MDVKKSSDGGNAPQRRSAPSAVSTSPVSSEKLGDSPKSVEDVLDALRSPTPPQKIPGFGPPKKTESVAKPAAEPGRAAEAAPKKSFQDRPRNPVGTAGLQEKSKPTGLADETENADKDSAWGSLANQLGVAVDDDFAIERESKPKAEARPERTPTEKRERDPEPAPTAKRSGFGTGLGLDASEGDDAGDIDDSFGAPRRAKPAAETKPAAENRERSSESARRPSRSRDSEPAAESSGKFISKKSSFEDKDSERSERGPRRRGRRRGVRQRITEEELERSEGSDDASKAGVQAVREDQPRRGDEGSRSRSGQAADSGDDSGRERGGRDRGGRGRSSRDSSSRDSSSRDSSSRDSSSRDSSSRDSQRGAAAEGGRRQRSAAKVSDEPNSRSDRSRSDRGRNANRDTDEIGFGANLFVDDIDDDELLIDDQDSEDTSPKSSDAAADRDEDSPRPRSRRRGRRGGRRGRNRDESSRSDEEVKDVDSDDTADPFGELPSFVDDLEDDDEAEAIRREKSRSQSGRGSRGNRDSKGRDSADPDSSSDTPSRSRGRGRRNESAAAGSVDRPSAPTWLETVSILVDANVENHKKTPARGGGGGRGRGGKRR
ncbi:hypothetical protein [Novipirellula sp.]|uniref:hypothetical protein n=1 Tax=Novipirellula sp. TaxID=2795430 RepID=UPI0035635346